MGHLLHAGEVPDLVPRLLRLLRVSQVGDGVQQTHTAPDDSLLSILIVVQNVNVSIII